MNGEQMRAEALQRIAVGLSLPPEIVEWMASDPDATSGSMLQASGIGRSPDVLAALVEVIECEPGDLCGAGTLSLPDGTPLPIVLDDIADELTRKYLRPILRAHGIDDPEAYSLGWQEEDR